MTSKYQVMAETHEGTTHILRKGFSSEEAALGHPVRLSLWKRVWVEKSTTPKPVEPPKPPFTVEWTGGFAYLLDSTGRRVASLLGTQANREHLAAILCSINANGEESNDKDSVDRQVMESPGRLFRHFKGL